MRVLVTYGWTQGGTEGLAHLVAEGLEDEGITVDLLPPGQMQSPLDDSATCSVIPPVKQVTALMNRVGARDHMTSGSAITAIVATGSPGRAP